MPALRFSHPRADIHVPWEGVEPEAALARVTHLCIGAHPDDIEAMAHHGIAACFGRDELWFGGVTVTDGAGSARTGPYADYSDEDMLEVRRREQRKAAFVGDYSIQIQLGYPSAEAKRPDHPALRDDLARILALARPSVVYLHQPADKHDTHVAVFAHALRALRALPRERQPEAVYGCEGWRDLDWLPDSEKSLLDSGARPAIAAALLGVFDSQNTGGKRFDLAVPARRRVNATFYDPHAIDTHEGLTCALDLTPLVRNPDAPVLEFIQRRIDRFRADVSARVSRFF